MPAERRKTIWTDYFKCSPLFNRQLTPTLLFFHSSPLLHCLICGKHVRILVSSRSCFYCNFLALQYDNLWKRNIFFLSHVSHHGLSGWIWDKVYGEVYVFLFSCLQHSIQCHSEQTVTSHPASSCHSRIQIAHRFWVLCVRPHVNVPGIFSQLRQQKIAILDCMLAILILNLAFMNFKTQGVFSILQMYCAARESDSLYLACFAITRLTDVN